MGTALVLVEDGVGERETFCEWVCDLMIFERSQGTMNVILLVERETPFCCPVPQQRTQLALFINKLMNVMELLPQPARRSITFGRGFEFCAWRKLKYCLGTEASFCDPQASR